MTNSLIPGQFKTGILLAVALTLLFAGAAGAAASSAAGSGFDCDFLAASASGAVAEELIRQCEAQKGTYELLLRDAMDKIFAVLESIDRRQDLTLAEKQQAAIDYLRGVRYGQTQKDYFSIVDMQGKYVMDPYIPNLVFKDLMTYVDRNGKELLPEILQTVRQNGEGYIDTMWPKYDGKRPVPKILFVRKHIHWDWVIITGAYLDTIEQYELPETPLRIPLATKGFSSEDVPDNLNDQVPASGR